MYREQKADWYQVIRSPGEQAKEYKRIGVLMKHFVHFEKVEVEEAVREDPYDERK